MLKLKISEFHNGDVWAGSNDGDMLVLKDGTIQMLSGWKEYRNGAGMNRIENGEIR